MAIQFAADFTWGAATSGPQAEGTFHKKHENILIIITIRGHRIFITMSVLMWRQTFTTIMNRI